MAARLEDRDPCGAQGEAQLLQSDAIAAVNAGRIPPAFQEEVLATVNALLESIECVPPPPDGEEEHEDEGEGKSEENEDEKEDGEGRGKGKGKKKGKGKD